MMYFESCFSFMSGKVATPPGSVSGSSRIVADPLRRILTSWGSSPVFVYWMIARPGGTLVRLSENERSDTPFLKPIVVGPPAEAGTAKPPAPSRSVVAASTPAVRRAVTAR